MSKFTLVYFGIEGRAGPIRNMCAIGNVPYEDETISDWAKLKPTLPYGQVPIIRVGDQVINQSKEILRYVSKLAGLYPDDPLEALQIDSLVANTIEIFEQTIGKTLFSKMETEEKRKMNVGFIDKKEGKLGKFLEKMDLQIGVGSSGYLFESGITAADLILFQVICQLSMGRQVGIPKSYARDNFDNLEAFRLKIASIEAISNRFKDEKHPSHGTPYTVDWKCDDDEKSG